MRRVSTSVTTAADGTASVDTSNITGFIERIVIDAGDLAAGAADITITDKTTGETILTVTNKAAGVAGFVPRDNIQTEAGADIAAAATSTNVWTRFAVSGKLNIAVAQGGNAKTGKVHVIVDDGAAYVR